MNRRITYSQPQTMPQPQDGNQMSSPYSPARQDPEGFWKNQDTLAGVPGQFGGMFADMFGTNSQAGSSNFDAYLNGTSQLGGQYGTGVGQAGSDYMNQLGGTYGSYANAVAQLGQGSANDMANLFGQYTTGYGNYNQALGESNRGYTGAQANYNNAVSNIGSAMGNEGAARFHSIGDIAQGDFGALGSISNAALANYGGMSNAAMANAAATQKGYFDSLAILSNANQNALSDFGISQNQGLSNLGQGVANVGIEDIRSRDQALTGAGNAYANLGSQIEAERLRAMATQGQSAATLGSNIGGNFAQVMQGASPYLINKDESSSSGSTVNLDGLFDGFGNSGGSPTTVTAVGPNGEIISTAGVGGGGGGSVGGGGGITSGGTKESESESSQSPSDMMGTAIGGAYGGIGGAGQAGFNQIDALSGLINNQDLGSRAYGGIDSVMDEIRNREGANQAYSELDKIRLGIQDSEIPGMLNANFNNVLGTMKDSYGQGLTSNKEMLDTMQGNFLDLATQGYGEVGKARDAAYDMVGKSGTDFSGLLGDLSDSYGSTRESLDSVRGDMNDGFNSYTGRFDTAADTMVRNDELALAGMGGLSGMLRNTQNRLAGGYGSQINNFNNMFDTQGNRIDDGYQRAADEQQRNFSGQNEALQDLFDGSFGDNTFFMSPEERQAEAERHRVQAEQNEIAQRRRKYEEGIRQERARMEHVEAMRKHYAGTFGGPIVERDHRLDAPVRPFI